MVLLIQKRCVFQSTFKDALIGALGAFVTPYAAMLYLIQGKNCFLLLLGMNTWSNDSWATIEARVLVSGQKVRGVLESTF